MVTFVLDVAGYFLDLYYRFRDIAHNSAYLPVVGALLESFFSGVSQGCWNIYYYLGKFAYRLNTWVSFVTDKLYYLDNLAYYVYQQITYLINSALNYARVTYDKVVEVLSRLDDIPHVINELIAVALDMVWDHIRQLPVTILDLIAGRLDDLRGSIMQSVVDLNEDTLKTIARPINLINTWFDAIQDFFNDPLESILNWLSGIAKKHEAQILNVFNKVFEALWG